MEPHLQRGALTPGPPSTAGGSGPALPTQLSPSDAAKHLADGETKIRHLYLHLPFCKRICPYCDFSTAVGAGADVPGFLKTLGREAELLSEAAVLCQLEPGGGTLYLGGGTPSWFGTGVLADLLAWVVSLAGGEWAEATLEMNPEHADPDRLRVLRSGGITRLSLGAQSLDPTVLRRLGRVHSPREVCDAARAARAGGFSVSVDLMFAVPGQEHAGWRADVDGIVGLEPDHISLYNLTYEPGTPFTRWLGTGRLQVLDDDWQAEAYTWAVERLRAAGYERYEVSNFARPGHASLHNQAYWNHDAYLGMGPSAHSLLGRVRTANLFHLKQWSEAVMEEGRLPWASVERLDELALARERVLLGLRTTRGLAITALPARYRQEVVRGAEELVGMDLAVWTEDRALVLTDRGVLLADELAARIAP